MRWSINGLFMYYNNQDIFYRNKYNDSLGFVIQCDISWVLLKTENGSTTINLFSGNDLIYYYTFIVAKF